MTQTMTLFPDEYRETELYEAAAAQEAKQAAEEHDFHVHINTRATQNRAAQLQQAIDEANEAARIERAAKEARMHAEEKQARAAHRKACEKAYYHRIVYILFAAVSAYNLMLIGVVSKEFTTIVCVASLAWICWEMLCAFRGIFRLLYRKPTVGGKV